MLLDTEGGFATFSGAGFLVFVELWSHVRIRRLAELAPIQEIAVMDAKLLARSRRLIRT
jgi:hypothetical protein